MTVFDQLSRFGDNPAINDMTRWLFCEPQVGVLGVREYKLAGVQSLLQKFGTPLRDSHQNARPAQ